MRIKNHVLYGSILILTLVANLSIKLIPFKKLIYMLTNIDYAEETYNTEKQKRRLILIIRLLKRVAQKVPWRVKCFEQAIVVLIFARVLKINMNVFFGISKTNDNKLLVHSWTKVENTYTTGGDDVSLFTVVYRRGYKSKY